MNKDGKLLELNLTLPEADIKGLHFNETKVKAFFELKNDGCYYSRDILFLSARQTDSLEGGDILTEYLETAEFRTAIANALPQDLKGEVEAFIPKSNQGVKRYNGVTWWYWLQDPYSASAAYFCNVTNYGTAHFTIASSIGGCAPAFRVEKQREAV